jgi:hypothetical protein
MNNKFDILKSQVNGITRMYEVPRCYRTQDITRFITNQIADGIKCFADMDELDKDSLVILMTQALGSDRVYSIIDMDDLDGIVTMLLNYVQHNGSDRAYDLAEAMREQLYFKFQYDADQLFGEICHDLYVADCEERGLRRHVDQINGEVSYI